MALVSCPSCSRHVRSNEDDCPFCQSALPKMATVNRGGVGSRAAMLLGASAVMIACGSEVKNPPGSSGGTSSSSGEPIYAPVYGAPAPREDAGTSSGGADAGEDGSVSVALYGAPIPVDAGASSSSGSSSSTGGAIPAYGISPGGM
jgi:hypothetical protein